MRTFDPDRSAEGYTPAGSTVQSPKLAVDPRILELSRRVANQNGRLVVPPGERAQYAQLPLRAWYDCDLYGPSQFRDAEIVAGRNQAGTKEKDESAISVWERHTKPSDWQGHWPGISIESITEDYLRQWIVNCLSAGLSRGYLTGLVNHIAWILSVAVDREVLSRVPKKPSVRQLAATRTGQLFSDDDCAVIYEIDGDILGTLDRICKAMAGQQELQTAFVLACSTGLRPVDLFGLTWANVKSIDGQPAIVAMPKKTKRYATTVRIPLAPAVYARLVRLRGDAADSALLFPGSVSNDCRDPEKSRSARRRNAAIKAAAESVGFEYPDRRTKPWQICRATANERLERHRPGIGEFILGHSAGSINKKHYRQRWSEAVEAINTLPQPPSFQEDVQPCETS